MKKLGIVLVIFGVFTLCYSQDNLSDYILKCISYLSKPAPENFSRMDRTSYLSKDRRIAIVVIDGVVIQSAMGKTFDRTNEAQVWLSQFYNYFENNNWVYSDHSEGGVEIYSKNNIYALINTPTKRDDNRIVAMVMFVDNIENMKK